ncbi:HAF repeat-containing protein [Massilia agilis]|uniref:HAF repeat-containing protein n=1 Tax=Massilia agilis TaxID=1811226 RepID=A0ABT2D6D6_9BURK|nr:HAF repeat-containing protein [Massilia agilis]MCS0806874.1 HAF repeat-containing protein [Massilia agilis]
MQLVAALKKLSALVVCSLPLLALADPRYGVTVIGTTEGSARGINSAGQVVGNFSISGGTTHAFLYSGASFFDLGTLGGASSAAWGINDAGQIVGSADNGSGIGRPFLYSGGSMNDLGTLGGQGGFAWAINNAGQVVGGADTAGGSQHPFLFSGGTMQDLGTLPASYDPPAAAFAINNHGMIAGASGTGDFTPPETAYHGWVRQGSGPLVDVGTFGGQYSRAYGINDLGDVVGVAATAELHFDNAFLYSNGILTPLGVLGGGYAEAYDINNLRQIVGAASGWGVSGGFLYEGGAMLDLTSLIDPASGWSVFGAYGINDLGQIAATVCKNRECFAARLDPLSPVSEPGQQAMLWTGVALLGAGALRRRGRAMRRCA